MGRQRTREGEEAEKARERARKCREENPERYKEQMRDYYQKNKEKIKQRAAKWREENKDRYHAYLVSDARKVVKKRSYEKHADDERRRSRDRNKRHRIELSDYYIKKSLDLHHLRNDEIPSQLTLLQREHLILKRELRNEERQ